MKAYFTTEYILKVKGTTCVIKRGKTKLQEIDLAIPTDLLSVLKTLPKDTELEVVVSQGTFYHDDTNKLIKREGINDS